MKTNKMIGNTYDLDMDKVTFNQLFNTTKKFTKTMLGVRELSIAPKKLNMQKYF